MTPVFTTRRQADALERVLAGGLDRDAVSRRDAAALAPLLELVSQVRAVAAPVPRPDVVADLRARLMVEAETALEPRDAAVEARLSLAPSDPAVRRRERRLAAVLGGAALVGATASIAVAAQGALPGETLYPVKRALEDVRTDVAANDVSRASMLLDQATSRLAEIDELARDGSPSDVAALPGTLDSFTAQAGRGGELLLDDYRSTGREASIIVVRDFAGESMTALSRLEGTLPDGSRDELLDAARTLAALDQQAGTLCPTCAGEGISEVPTVFASAGGTGGVTEPASLPGIELPGIALPRVTGTRSGTGSVGDRSSGRPTDDTGTADTGTADRPTDRPTDDRGTDPSPRPDPPKVSTPDRTTGTKVGTKVGTNVGKDVTQATTDAIDTITGTLTGTGTAADDVVGGVVDGVDDVVEGTGELVDGTVGGLSGGLGGLTGGLSGH